MAQLQRALDIEWSSYCQTPDARRAIKRWTTEDSRYATFSDLEAVRLYFERRDNVEERESLMADLLQRSPDDLVARRLLLAALRPGLRRLARWASSFWEPDEAESIVIAAAVDRLADRQITIPRRVAAGVLGSVWTSVWNRRRRERWEEDFWGGRADPEALDGLPAEDPDTARADLAHLVDEAVRRGAVPARGARLVVLHWVYGYSNAELANLDGLRPCTIRKHRRDAEIRLAEFAA